ncbi:MAG: hypothetical protein EBS16_01360 [Betaproteobacteria bacterium]|nr:hypothetical protein [Betaproteobacteria bacterium]
MTPDTLAQRLLEAVRALDFGATADAHLQGGPLQAFPSIDLAVVAFPSKGSPVWANVLFSREHPQGVVAQMAPAAGAILNIRFLADLRDAQGVSVAWLPGADWRQWPWRTLAGSGPLDMVAPYPASLLKLMVAVGVGMAVDWGLCRWDQSWPFAGQARTIAQWGEDMIVTSSNESTSALVALLHALGLINEQPDPGARHALHQAFESRGLLTLRLAGTRKDGAWGNAAGAGVGQIQMTAWDTARLLWLLDPRAPLAPWPGASPLLSPQSRDRVLAWLADQGLHEILSSGLLQGLPDHQSGIPAQLPLRWRDGPDAIQVGDRRLPGDVRAWNERSQVTFWHKTGTTENYASDAGIVQGVPPHQRHYLVALLTNLGTRYASDPSCATTWRLPMLGAAIDTALATWLESEF